MPKKKKSLSKEEVRLLEGQAKYEASFPRVLEAIDQMQKKEGPIFETWKARMRAYLDSLESKEG